ncbi:hypothetical protein JXQ31_19960 [candidate division KSB1 bacterium]|nr:hypothetical protein [candidate division KSB1 bacterium]
MESYWTKERLDLKAWFQRNAPSLGELYEGVLKLLYTDEKIPGWTRFVAHAIREIGNRLPDIVIGVQKNTYLDVIYISVVYTFNCIESDPL